MFCDNNWCALRVNDIPCTDMCKLKKCLNSVSIEERVDNDDRDDGSEILGNSDED